MNKKHIPFGLILLILSFGISTVLKSQNWDSLKSGFNLPPTVLYADSADNYLYAAGVFYTVDHKHIKGIARWNGVQWDSLKSGVEGLNPNFSPGNTNAIKRYNNKLYVAGDFNSLGGIPAACIGTWDGNNWDTLSIQPFKNNHSNSILTLGIINNELYIGGIFDTINNIPCKGIGKWNGSTWTCINMPPMPYTIAVDAITEYNGEIYIGGNFHTSAYPNDTIQDILKYSGSAWHSVGGGFRGSAAGVECMAVYNNELYVAGAFKRSDGNVGNYIQKWNGTVWSDVGGGTGGINGQIHELQVFNNKLYVMGVFQQAGGVPAQFIASWDGTNWCGFGSTFDNIIIASCVYHDSLYIGGGFWTIDGTTMNRISKWVGGNYVDTCGHLNVGINEILNKDSELNIYPNPTTNQFTLEFDLAENKNTSIEIKNILGQTLKKIDTDFSTGKNKIEIDVSEFSNGLYFIQLQNGYQIVSEKLVKQ